MKLIVQSFLYCCLLATVARCGEFDVKPQLRKRPSIWFRNRLRRDLDRVSVERTEELQHFVSPDEVRVTRLPHSSTDFNVRTKRSKNSGNQTRRQGCSLGTCIVHDLAHRLHQLGNKYKFGNAPEDKMSPQGYGRRRRSVPEQRVTLRLEQGRLRPVWSRTASHVHKLEALLRRT
uniref:Adrenomedullin a n=2 Tax=Tetraodon nigroviridis TaxID=99883 RepID=H3CVF1_TETNG